MVLIISEVGRFVLALRFLGELVLFGVGIRPNFCGIFDFWEFSCLECIFCVLFCY